MTCPCKKKGKTMEANPATPQDPATPARTGACPFCTRKHLLRARGYARELAEDPTREWERDNLLENLLLAEDHLAALGDALADELREIRHGVEEGRDMALAVAGIYDRFKARYFPTAPTPSTPSTPSTEF
jgi:hypothetical protein